MKLMQNLKRSRRTNELVRNPHSACSGSPPFLVPLDGDIRDARNLQGIRPMITTTGRTFMCTA
jgi:hypothetical protein